MNVDLLRSSYSYIHSLNNYISLVIYAAFKTIISVPIDSVQTTFNATVGDTVVLPCPVPPGALRQSYSVIWMKESLPILTVNPENHTIARTDPRYGIDDIFSLIIESVNDVNDSNSCYECMLYSTNPVTDVRHELQSHPQRNIKLTLNVLATASTGEPGSDNRLSE